MPGALRVYRDATDQLWRFEVHSGNGSVIATSRGYGTKAAAQKGCQSLRLAASGATVYTDGELKVDQRPGKPPMLTHDSVIYYVLFPGCIKVGYTTNLASRLGNYRVAVPADSLLAVEPGGRDVEKQRHDQFKQWRLHRRREDFADTPELRAHIEAVVTEHGDPLAWINRVPVV